MSTLRIKKFFVMKKRIKFVNYNSPLYELIRILKHFLDKPMIHVECPATMTRLKQSVDEFAGVSGDACGVPSQQQSLPNSSVIRYDVIVNKFLHSDGIRTSALIYRSKTAGLFNCVRYAFRAKTACLQKKQVVSDSLFFANKRQKQAESSNAPL